MTVALIRPGDPRNAPPRRVVPGDPCPACGSFDLRVSGEVLTVGRINGFGQRYPARCACGWSGLADAAGCYALPADAP